MPRFIGRVETSDLISNTVNASGPRFQRLDWNLLFESLSLFPPWNAALVFCERGGLSYNIACVLTPQANISSPLLLPLSYYSIVVHLLGCLSSRLSWLCGLVCDINEFQIKCLQSCSVWYRLSVLFWMLAIGQYLVSRWLLSTFLKLRYSVFCLPRLSFSYKQSRLVELKWRVTYLMPFPFTTRTETQWQLWLERD